MPYNVDSAAELGQLRGVSETSAANVDLRTVSAENYARDRHDRRSRRVAYAALCVSLCALAVVVMLTAELFIP